MNEYYLIFQSIVQKTSFVIFIYILFSLNISNIWFETFYNPKTNRCIEEYFNQIKHYLKINKKVLKYDELKEAVKKAIKNVSKNNYKNYFNNAYNKEVYKDYIRKISTLKRKLKNYKD